MDRDTAERTRASLVHFHLAYVHPLTLITFPLSYCEVRLLGRHADTTNTYRESTDLMSPTSLFPFLMTSTSVTKIPLTKGLAGF